MSNDSSSSSSKFSLNERVLDADEKNAPHAKYDASAYFDGGEHGMIFAMMQLHPNGKLPAGPQKAFVCAECAEPAFNQHVWRYTVHMYEDKKRGRHVWVEDRMQFCTFACLYMYATHSKNSFYIQLMSLTTYKYMLAYNVLSDDIARVQEHAIPRTEMPSFRTSVRPGDDTWTIQSYRESVHVKLHTPNPKEHVFIANPEYALFQNLEYVPGWECTPSFAEFCELLRKDNPKNDVIFPKQWSANKDGELAYLQKQKQKHMQEGTRTQPIPAAAVSADTKLQASSAPLPIVPAEVVGTLPKIGPHTSEQEKKSLADKLLQLSISVHEK